MSRDMGPITRCLGKNVPPVQPFQHFLPNPPTNLPDFEAVKRALITMMTTANSNVLEPDVVDLEPNYGAVFVQLAWQCASTYRRCAF